MDLELTRSPSDRKLFELDGVGTLRFEGLFARTAIAEVDGRSWLLARRGFWGRRIEATETGGGVVGKFEPRTVRRGGALRWAGRELELRSASKWRERYALADGDRELALLDGKGWGRRPVKITLDDLDAVEAPVLLFAVFVVRTLAEDASGAAGGSVAATS
jgi:hypothetical protein